MPGMNRLVNTPSSPPSPTSPAIGVSSRSLTFTAQQGGSNPATETLRINNTGGGTLNWSASSNSTWLTVLPNSGTGDGTITVQATTGSLTAINHTATITLSAPGVTPVPVQVTFRVTAVPPAPSLTLNTSPLAFTATQGTNPAAQPFTVTSNVTWTARTDQTWLIVSPASGSNNGTITARVDTANASLGNNTATITVTGGGITQTVNATLQLDAPSTSSSATLTWDRNSESDLAGYNVYRATSPGAYTPGSPIATLQGNVTSYIATGLQSGTTYYFVITAYDNAGNESSYSSEVSQRIN